jgi:hypothetical protein
MDDLTLATGVKALNTSNKAFGHGLCIEMSLIANYDRKFQRKYRYLAGPFIRKLVLN